MQSLVPHYLEASMTNFRANQSKLAKAFEETLGNNPLAKLAQQNLAMFRAAASAFLPGGEKDEAAAPAGDTQDELAILRAQMAEMQRKLDSLAK